MSDIEAIERLWKAHIELQDQTLKFSQQLLQTLALVKILEIKVKLLEEENAKKVAYISQVAKN